MGFLVDEDEARAVFQLPVDVTEVKCIPAQFAQIRSRSGEEVPLFRIRAGTALRKPRNLRSVSVGIDREGDHSDVPAALDRFAHLFHLAGHARARTHAVGKDKVREPDMPVERLFAAKRLSGLVGENEIGTTPND